MRQELDKVLPADDAQLGEWTGTWDLKITTDNAAMY